MASFESILDKPVDAIKPPEALPVGTYLCIVDGPGEYVKVGKNDTPAFRVAFKPLQAQADVDQEKLAEILNGQALNDKKINANFFVTDAASYRLKDFCIDSLGIEGTGKSLRQVASEIQGKQVLVNLGHRASDDGKAIYNEVKSYARV